MNLFFLLISFCYHDRDSFAGVIWGDDDEYYLNDDNYNLHRYLLLKIRLFQVKKRFKT